MDWDQFTSIDLQGLATPDVFERGLDYYRNGHVTTTARVDNVLAGIVIGTGGDYQARLWIEDETVHHQCSCPYPDFCKHLVALACGWLENKPGFIDLRPLLDGALQDSAGLPDLFIRLVYENPMGFITLMNQTKASASSRCRKVSQTPREMVNLLRNIFQNTPLFRMSQIEALQEKLSRAESLLRKEMAEANPEALPLYMEMLQGITAIYKEHKLPELAGYVRSLFAIPFETAGRFGKEAIGGLYSLILHDYFDLDLWEFKEELKELLRVFHAIDPQVLFQFWMEQSARDSGAEPDANHTGFLNLISWYELLTPEAIFQHDPDLSHALENVIQNLKVTVEGRLWLIDRLMADNPAESYRLARSALVGGMEPKRSFRDRLVMIHWQRGECRQAASLSFIQFQEEPNFEEYLRLKDILKKHPGDWQNYNNRLRSFLRKTGNDALAFRIALDQGDCTDIKTLLGKAAQTPSSLLKVAGLLLENGTTETAEIYPKLIRLLIDEKIFSCWNASLKMLINYKKLCLQTGETEEWDNFRMELLGEHPDDKRFRRKFGGILGIA